MPETSNTNFIGLRQETASHAKLLERSARADELEFHLLDLEHLVDLQPTILDLHQRKSNIFSDFDGVT
jgi:hypothetical protein